MLDEFEDKVELIWEYISAAGSILLVLLVLCYYLLSYELWHTKRFLPPNFQGIEMLDELKDLEDKKYIMSQGHNSLPLRIYNYTNACTYADGWCDLTLKCRGLVVDDTGNICNNPLQKFFNWQEQRGKYSCDFKRSFIATEKLDGSFIQAFMYGDALIVSSRGSFHSDHSNWAYEILII